jgi:hypothetical protein
VSLKVDVPVLSPQKSSFSPLDFKDLKNFDQSEELAMEAIQTIRSEKIIKAGKVLLNYLDISLSIDDILEVLKDKAIEKSMKVDESVLEEIKDSYVLEYYRTELVRP